MDSTFRFGLCPNLSGYGADTKVIVLNGQVSVEVSQCSDKARSLLIGSGCFVGIGDNFYPTTFLTTDAWKSIFPGIAFDVVDPQGEFVICPADQGIEARAIFIELPDRVATVAIDNVDREKKHLLLDTGLFLAVGECLLATSQLSMDDWLSVLPTSDLTVVNAVDEYAIAPLIRADSQGHCQVFTINQQITVILSELSEGIALKLRESGHFSEASGTFYSRKTLLLDDWLQLIDDCEVVLKQSEKQVETSAIGKTIAPPAEFTERLQLISDDLLTAQANEILALNGIHPRRLRTLLSRGILADGLAEIVLALTECFLLEAPDDGDLVRYLHEICLAAGIENSLPVSPEKVVGGILDEGRDPKLLQLLPKYLSKNSSGRHVVSIDPFGLSVMHIDVGAGASYSESFIDAEALCAHLKRHSYFQSVSQDIQAQAGSLVASTEEPALNAEGGEVDPPDDLTLLNWDDSGSTFDQSGEQLKNALDQDLENLTKGYDQLLVRRKLLALLEDVDGAEYQQAFREELLGLVPGPANPTLDYWIALKQLLQLAPLSQDKPLENIEESGFFSQMPATADSLTAEGQAWLSNLFAVPDDSNRKVAKLLRFLTFPGFNSTIHEHGSWWFLGGVFQNDAAGSCSWTLVSGNGSVSASNKPQLSLKVWEAVCRKNLRAVRQSRDQADWEVRLNVGDGTDYFYLLETGFESREKALDWMNSPSADTALTHLLSSSSPRRKPTPQGQVANDHTAIGILPMERDYPGLERASDSFLYMMAILGHAWGLDADQLTFNRSLTVEASGSVDYVSASWLIGEPVKFSRGEIAYVWARLLFRWIDAGSDRFGLNTDNDALKPAFQRLRCLPVPFYPRNYCSWSRAITDALQELGGDLATVESLSYSDETLPLLLEARKLVEFTSASHYRLNDWLVDTAKACEASNEWAGYRNEALFTRSFEGATGWILSQLGIEGNSVAFAASNRRQLKRHYYPNHSEYMEIITGFRLLMGEAY
ncbi:hypothetical protein [Marinobacterium jannaschii]|uniref:hypothetical protein n=1 Tax=Marinobacterium jannaschii TaxID=64970 RepID=UPI00048A0811|nr:hypothetical protein [Marinobacterium jannaschii]